MPLHATFDVFTSRVTLAIGSTHRLWPLSVPHAGVAALTWWQQTEQPRGARSPLALSPGQRLSRARSLTRQDGAPQWGPGAYTPKNLVNAPPPGLA